MADTMIERAAAALCQDMTGKPYDGLSSIGQKMMQRHARAVIAAMRYPTNEMSKSAFTLDEAWWFEAAVIGVEGDVRTGAQDKNGVWQKMIDAALAQEV